MKRKPIEIRFAWNQPDGNVLVQTGIYIFNTMTLQEVYELAKRSENPPDFIEMDIAQFEEDEE